MIRKIYQELCGAVYTRRQQVYWCLGLGVLAALLLGKYLFSGTLVLSKAGTDVWAYYYHAYSLAFDGLRQGQLVEWNPYQYGGQPFLGPFQSALLYAPTWLAAALPVTLALNWLIWFHTWLLGAGVFGWAVWRGCRPAAAFAAAAALMLGGQYFSHIYAGHISNLGSMAWAPLVFWGVDGWLRQRRGGWLALAAAAAALQLYAGHPQYFYYTAIVSGLFALVFLWDAERKVSAIAGLLAIYPLALALSAAQLLPGLAASAESVRAGAGNHDFAAMFALPWENWLTLLVPGFFGDMESAPYWGRCYLWEMQLYLGVGALAVAAIGFAHCRRRRKIQVAALLLVIALLGLGARTPLYDGLYYLVPGFGLFRGTSKFMFFFALALTVLAAHGLSGLFNGAGGGPRRWLVWTLAVTGALAFFGALSLTDSDSLFVGWVQAAAQSGESYLRPDWFARDANLAAAQSFTVAALVKAGVWLLVFAGALWAAWRWRRAAWAFAALMVLDSVIFAWSLITGFAAAEVAYAPLRDVTRQFGDGRVLNALSPAANMSLRSEGLWGYDPFVLKRYAEFVAATQGVPPDEATQNLRITQNTPLLALLRARAAFLPQPDGQVKVEQLNAAVFPRFYIVSKWRVVQGRDAVLRALSAPDFDPKQEVILEEDPLLPPDIAEAQYQIRMLGGSTDAWMLDIQTTRACVLVMTDAYSRDWRVKELPGSVQTNYHVLPANYALRAIPLAPGRHVIRIEYQPGYFGVGLLVSALAWVTLAVALWKLTAIRTSLVR
ncbi:MAG: YfhO family protein [Verrucomicrobiales bacterium]|jgi:hypothetical protein|nr:YfhO family protein [Verrucomicrobiales bacterium]